MERLVKGDQVVVTVGKDRGKQGEILRRVEGGKFVVQGINLVKKHTKPNPALGRTGGIVEKKCQFMSRILLCSIQLLEKAIK